MDTSNWRPNQGGNGGGGDSSMESVDWRTQLPTDSRQKIINRITETFMKHPAFSGPEKLHELKNIALRFEEKIYYAATSHSEYMRKISMKLLGMENRAANPIANSLQSNSAGNGVNPSDPGSQGMQQANNQGQSLPVPVPSNHPQAVQQILPQSIHNNIASSGVQGSTGVSSALPLGSGLSQSSMPNISGQNSGLQNIQNISGVQQNPVGNGMGQGIPSNNFVSQRQMPGRQQLPPQQQQQSQNSQHYLYQQQLHQIAKQKLQQNNSTTSVQSHIQQQHQNLLQPSHFQPSQQSVMQPTMLQPSSLSNVQQNQQPLTQSAQPVMQHHQQTVLRQQRQQQQQPPSIVHQQQTSAINLQHNQLIGTQSSYSEMQQQQQPRLLGQQSNLSNMQQMQQHSIGQHNNFSAMHQQLLGPQSSSTGQQHQLLGTQSGNSTMANNQHSAHLLQSKVSIPQQNQPTQGQRSQPELQQQMMPQLQTQSGQLQHQLNTKLQPNLPQRDMQQRLPTPGAFLQQNVTDQQKQLLQQQRPMAEASSTSSDSTAQTGNPSGGDWQEEVYQKLKAMKDKYMPELNDMYQKVIGKLQQHDSLPQQPKSEQVEKLKMIKHALERYMAFLQVSKSNISPNYKEKLGIYERQIINIISPHKRKPGVPPQQTQALPPQHIHSLQQENQMNPQMQSVAMQQNNIGNLQHNSILPSPGVSNAQQNMMNATQPTSNLDPGQNSTMNSLQQVNINHLSSQGGMGILQPNSSMLQHQQLKQLQYRQMQQQYLHKQQLLQQQFQRQTKQQQQQQQNGQLQMNQLPQLHQINDGNELKLRQQIGVKPESLQQRPVYHQQLKSGPPFSPQLLSASSPLTPQHPSPQLDQQNLLNSLTKSGTPLQSANSPFIVSSPSTPSTSHMPGESEKVNSGVSSLSNAGNIGHQPTAPTQSLAIGTPGISASPLLAEFTSPDGNNGNGTSIVSAKSSAIEQPIDHLLKVVKSISSKSLSASVSDIGSVVSMIDRIAGSAPGNGSRAAVGEDLVDMTKFRLQAKTFGTQDGTRKMKRFTSAMPLNVLSSASNVNDSFKHLNYVEASELESTATSTIKRPRIETSHPLLEEIRDINQGLIDTVVDISEEDADPAGGGKGTIVKCSFIAVALAPNLKSQYASPQMSPIQPLRLLVPTNYPNCSPILLDKFPADISKEYEDLSVKAQWRFGSCIRQLSEPMSLEEMVRTWDICARTVISEYAQQTDGGGGGTFSSKYGAWEDCLTLTGTAA